MRSAGKRRGSNIKPYRLRLKRERWPAKETKEN